MPEDSKAAGRITSTIAHGELFLHPKGNKQQRYRLRWSPDDTERALPLPAGTYKVTGYRHVASANDGTQWIWSTTSAGYSEIEVTAGATTHFAVRQALVVKAQAFEKKGIHRVSLAFQSEEGLGNTIYQSGKRIGIRWQCLDADGAVLTEGNMRYG